MFFVRNFYRKLDVDFIDIVINILYVELRYFEINMFEWFVCFDSM